MISFGEIVLAIEADGLFDVLLHPNTGRDPNQQVIVVTLYACEKNELKPVCPSRADLARFKVAASAAFIRGRRINIRFLRPTRWMYQARALEEAVCIT